MRTLALVTLMVCGATACHRLPFRSDRDAPVASDSLYWKAINHLDAANRAGSLDSAVVALDAYLTAGGTQRHRQEALVLRQLSRNSRQLARVESLLQQARADSLPSRAASNEAELRKRDEESVKEIQRLKEELAKANEELERIRKRLAAPKPPASRH